MNDFKSSVLLFLKCMDKGLEEAKQEFLPGKVSDKAYCKLHHNIPGYTEKIQSLYLSGDIEVAEIGLRK
jgi:hypothetical protein